MTLTAAALAQLVDIPVVRCLIHILIVEAPLVATGLLQKLALRSLAMKQQGVRLLCLALLLMAAPRASPMKSAASTMKQPPVL